MVAAALRRSARRSGLRRFNPFTDTRHLVDLIAAAFADDMDASGRHALAQMRRSAGWLGWLTTWPWFLIDDEALAGFVWEEDGRIVGNLSLRRAPALGWLIGNVAVAGEWRRRGIGRALVQAALEAIKERGGHWVGLEVRADNTPARTLYEAFGFDLCGETQHMLRPAGLPWSPVATRAGVRPARASDGPQLKNMLRESYNETQRYILGIPWSRYQPGLERTLDNWLDGRRERWWVAERDGRAVAAVRGWSERSIRWHGLELLAAAGFEGGFEDTLVAQAIGWLSHFDAWESTAVQQPNSPAVAALQQVGYAPARRLIQMQLQLGTKIRVRPADTRLLVI